LASPEVASWTGAYVVYDDLWPLSADWAKAQLLDPNNTHIAEEELARGLDYPGDESGEWISERWECLTSFIVLQKELPQTALHRIRYQAIKMFDIEMQVNMDTSMIDEFSME
ncbi:hypothetical protein LPJ70_003503, partial [Coemansia sp. RSA 2708]